MTSTSARALCLASALVLFLELALIRWIAACVPVVAFFSNLVLVAAFLGIGLGCRRAAARPRPVVTALCLAGVLAASALARWAYDQGAFRVGVASPDQIYFGTVPLGEAERAQVPAEVVLGAIYVVLVVLFAHLGQWMGCAFDRVGDARRAYAANLAGSLAGIGAFAAASAWELPPIAWFALALVALAAVMRPASLGAHIAASGLAIAGLGAVAFASHAPAPATTVWSPYYRIDVLALDDEVHVDTNGLAHQIIRPLHTSSKYRLPHALARAAGLPARARVLVIGAGTGNDVAHALAFGATRVRAVEIDPAIARLGEALHPEHPYDDPRVELAIDDGRTWLDRTDERYDLIVYALVDSLTLHSSYGSVRLENFLFTEEAILRVKDRLAPGGIFAAYNYYREDWLIVRLERLLARVFEAPPVVIALPARSVISDKDPAPGEAPAAKHALLLAGDVGPIGAMLGDPARRGVPQGAVASRVEATSAVELPTDDWPFVYLRRASVPVHNVRMWAVLLALSLVLARLFPAGSSGPTGGPRDAHFFWLGAGFLLLETAGVVRLAALFGTTWVTSSIAFAAILAMAFLANASTRWFARPPTWAIYAALALALGVFAAVPSTWLSPLGFAPRLVAAGCWLALPVFCSGLVFARSLARSAAPARALGANIAGAVAGAALENLSSVTGYRGLVGVIAVCYALSWIALARPEVSRGVGARRPSA